ncbi:UNVERIFIED_CONTAM: hypothetical protein Sradi_5638300 [Sesamum radiatum]|uniref:Uncharacterized protein n=1 Tax=Sesamum radiatum TaxID=300843 RepID=A0AAW2KZJ1_SESRA
MKEFAVQNPTNATLRASSRSVWGAQGLEPKCTSTSGTGLQLELADLAPAPAPARGSASSWMGQGALCWPGDQASSSRQRKHLMPCPLGFELRLKNEK